MVRVELLNVDNEGNQAENSQPIYAKLYANFRPLSAEGSSGTATFNLT
jgi:hypothetical protein